MAPAPRVPEGRRDSCGKVWTLPKRRERRMLLVLAGLPEPTVNLIIRNPDGSWRMRFDLSYPGLKLIIEYDGRQHSRTAVNGAETFLGAKSWIV
jgi:hypothetical protein